MALVRPDLTFNRSAIMACAWREFRDPLNRPGVRGCRSFGECLSYAWRVAKGLRERMADGSLERERREAAEREAEWQAYLARETPEQRQAVWAGIMHSCSTDGRLPEHRNA